MIRVLISILVAALLAACAGARVRSHVEVFHEIPKNLKGGTIAILSSDPQRAKTIEFRTYSQKLESKLKGAGFDAVSLTEIPKYIAFLGYAVGEGQQITRNYTIPQFGGASQSSAQRQPVTFAGGFAQAIGGTSSITKTITSTYYSRALIVSIFDINWADLQNSKHIYQLSISSSGTCPRLSAVIDAMLEAGFREFPGDNGTLRKIDIPWKSDC